MHHRYSYQYVRVYVYVYVCVCVCVQSPVRSGVAMVTTSLSWGRSFVETLLGARAYPKSVDQGRQHYVFHLLYLFLYCLATSVFGRLQHQNTALW